MSIAAEMLSSHLTRFPPCPAAVFTPGTHEVMSEGCGHVLWGFASRLVPPVGSPALTAAAARVSSSLCATHPGS